MATLLESTIIVLPDDSKVNAKNYLKDKIVLLYFSAGWCPPCRAFTPKLKKFYEALKAEGKNLEIIFVSRDRDAKDLLEYYKEHHGSWTYLEFGNPLILEFLAKFEIKTIPGLKLIKPDGTVIVQDARTEIQNKGSNPIALYEEWLALYNA